MVLLTGVLVNGLLKVSGNAVRDVLTRIEKHIRRCVSHMSAKRGCIAVGGSKASLAEIASLAVKPLGARMERHVVGRFVVVGA